METTMQVPACIMCESTNVHYNSDANKFICDTCGEHTTEVTTKTILSKTGKVVLVFLLMLISCISHSQIAIWKDSVISVPDTTVTIKIVSPKIHLSYPFFNISGIDKKVDTLLIDASKIKYIKINNGTSILLADLIKPKLIDLAAYFDSIKVLYGSSITAYPSYVIPVGNGPAIKLPTSFTGCEIDTAIFRLLSSLDTSRYYYDSNDGILKAKPIQINKVSNSQTVINKLYIKTSEFKLAKDSRDLMPEHQKAVIINGQAIIIKEEDKPFSEWIKIEDDGGTTYQYLHKIR